MTDFKVIIPDESYSLLNFRQDNSPGVAVVNTALKEFEPKIVFAWHLSIMIDLDDLIDNGMPSKSEVEVINAYSAPYYTTIPLQSTPVIPLQNTPLWCKFLAA